MCANIPMLTNMSIAARFGMTQKSIWQALRELGGLKHPKADNNKRRVFQKKIKACKKPIVDIDESGFAHDMPPRGRAVTANTIGMRAREK